MNIDELEPGKRYRFRTKETEVVGELRSTRYPGGYAGVGDPGKTYLWVTGGVFEYFFDPEDLESVEEVE